MSDCRVQSISATAEDLSPGASPCNKDDPISPLTGNGERLNADLQRRGEEIGGKTSGHGEPWNLYITNKVVQYVICNILLGVDLSPYF